MGSSWTCIHIGGDVAEEALKRYIRTLCVVGKNWYGWPIIEVDGVPVEVRAMCDVKSAARCYVDELARYGGCNSDEKAMEELKEWVWGSLKG